MMIIIGIIIVVVEVATAVMVLLNLTEWTKGHCIVLSHYQISEHECNVHNKPVVIEHVPWRFVSGIHRHAGCRLSRSIPYKRKKRRYWVKT